MSATRELYERISDLISRGYVKAAEEVLKRLFTDDFDVENETMSWIEMQIKGVRSIMAEPLRPDAKRVIEEDNPEEG